MVSSDAESPILREKRHRVSSEGSERRNLVLRMDNERNGSHVALLSAGLDDNLFFCCKHVGQGVATDTGECQGCCLHRKQEPSRSTHWSILVNTRMWTSIRFNPACTLVKTYITGVVVFLMERHLREGGIQDQQSDGVGGISNTFCTTLVWF